MTTETPCPCGKGFITEEDQKSADEFIENEKKALSQNIFTDVEKTLADVTGCSNPFCQNYPDQEQVWEDLKAKWGAK